MSIAFIDRGIEGNLAVAGHQQSQTELPEVRPLLLGVAALSEVRAEIGAGEIGKEVRGVVEQRIEGEGKFVDDLASQLRFNGLQRRPGDHIHLIPKKLTGQRGGLEGKEMRQRGTLRPGRPATLGARPDGPVHSREQ